MNFEGMYEFMSNDQNVVNLHWKIDQDFRNAVYLIDCKNFKEVRKHIQSIMVKLGLKKPPAPPKPPPKKEGGGKGASHNAIDASLKELSGGFYSK